MSIAHAADALLIPRMEPTSKLLLIAMALGSDARGKGEATPTELSLWTGLSQRTIRSHRGHLARQGLIDARAYDAGYQLIGPAIRQRATAL